VNYSRRDLSLLLPALAAASGSAAETGALPSKIFAYDDLPVRNNGRSVLNGKTHKGLAVESHQTQLAPGKAPHAPHHHEHVEMIFVHEGILEVTIAGTTKQIGPGGVVYVASNEEHGWKNVGTTNAHYFVLALGMERS
jgi:mannose-6-phosphate isomerase-like protein (cupin superfamily)